MICISFGNSLQNYWLVLRTREYLVARVNTSPVELLDWMSERLGPMATLPSGKSIPALCAFTENSSAVRANRSGLKGPD